MRRSSWASPTGRREAQLWAIRAREAFNRTAFGLEPDRSQIEAEWAIRRQRGIEEVRRSLTAFYNGTGEEMRALFRVAGMDPEHALIRYGRGEQAFVISSQVFEPDSGGRSYRFRPNLRSIWLRQITIRGGPFSMFQVPDTPAHRAAAGAAGGIVDEGSVQTTNSWGLRGPEPDLSADVRGVVLGDSFMQAMFNGDEDTPSLYLERFLRSTWRLSVSVLNTGHIGYSPEQYYYSLVEYGEKFRPHFVVVSVCPNDLGDGGSVMAGRADWLSEAEYWLDQIHRWCVARNTVCLVVGVPIYSQIESVRRDDLYPAALARAFHGPPTRYCFPLDEFIDEHLRLTSQAQARGLPRDRSLLYNRPIDDDHFSPSGAELWGKIVGRRLVRIFDVSPKESTRKAGTNETPLNAPAARAIP
ncbi:MAG: SGNH/GDSL hydrolase family protein [Isosphaeraceae bacterium]